MSQSEKGSSMRLNLTLMSCRDLYATTDARKGGGRGQLGWRSRRVHRDVCKTRGARAHGVPEHMQQSMLKPKVMLGTRHGTP